MKSEQDIVVEQSVKYFPLLDYWIRHIPWIIYPLFLPYIIWKEMHRPSNEYWHQFSLSHKDQ